MPFYAFKCPKCSREQELFREIKNRNISIICECGNYMERDLPAESPHAQSRGRMYGRPIHSDALAISPTQVAEHKRLFPNIEIDSECRPVFDNFPDHEAYLEKTGFIKHRNAPKRRPTKKIKQRLL